MGKIIRLTESDLSRIVRRVIKEQEDTEACSVSVMRLFNQLKKVLTREEEMMLISAYKEMGKDAFEDEVEDTLQGNDINEGRSENRKLKRVINKVAKTILQVSPFTMIGGVVLGACLSPDNMQDSTSAMGIASAASAGIGLLSIPLMIISFVVAAKTED